MDLSAELTEKLCWWVFYREICRNRNTSSIYSKKSKPKNLGPLNASFAKEFLKGRKLWLIIGSSLRPRVVVACWTSFVRLLTSCLPNCSVFFLRCAIVCVPTSRPGEES